LVAARAVMALNHAAMVRIHERRPVDAVSRRHSAFGRFRRLTLNHGFLVNETSCRFSNHYFGP
jgi:hypothetical protein